MHNHESKIKLENIQTSAESFSGSQLNSKKIATAWIKLWLSTKLLPTLGQLHSVPCHPVFLLAKTRFRTGQEEWFAHGICGGCTAGPLKIGDYVASSFQKEYLLLGARLCPPSHQIPF
jgi:hypothetical protein